MPYINRTSRKRLEDKNEILELGGELNYRITEICNEFLVDKNYDGYNEIIGVLECVKLEFYRRAVAPYEDQKIAENGDVFPS